MTNSDFRDYRTVRRVHSPDGSGIASVVLYEPYAFADQRLRMDVYREGRKSIIYKDDGMDVDPCFAEIAWSNDSNTVAFFVNNCYGRILRRAFDCKNLRPLPDTAGDYLLRAALVRDFRFRPGRYGDPYPPLMNFIADPLEWGGTNDAARIFRDGERENKWIQQ
ncbi:MAG: hypothetical protein JWO80_6500 [Bryobacterales bacterium]|nr:hypothetical protein [Bryobacterales bacterium]